VIASAPGKLMLAGEYAVIEGGPAIMTAVDRRVVARAGKGEGALLEAVARVTASAREVVVDSSALHEGGLKLGLGSSAAAAVAATAFVLAAEHHELDRDEVHRLASQAHGDAQALRGARGSGADVAACTYGGVILFTRGAIEPFALPDQLRLVPFWTGAPADTASLVARVMQAATPALLEPIAASARALVASKSAQDAIAALDAGADALDALGRAASIDLLTPPVRALRKELQRLGGTCKTCGAGGGDVAIAALPASADLEAVRALVQQVGATPLGISVGAPGVEILR